jgi:hypothetical protein
LRADGAQGEKEERKGKEGKRKNKKDQAEDKSNIVFLKILSPSPLLWKPYFPKKYFVYDCLD